jgi:deoxyguanosine kinase
VVVSSSAPRTIPAFQPPRFIAIEGPIRVGKSTLARFLAEKLHARRVVDCEDNPFLRDYYEEKPGAAFRTQMYFLFERQRRMREVNWEAPGTVVSDFLFEKDKIFAYLSLDDAELKLYERYYDLFAAGLPRPDLVIYLQARPDVLEQRVRKKADPAEAQLSRDYLVQVSQAYEHFFFRYTASDLLVVNTSEIDFVERNQDLQELLRRLQQPVKGTQYFLPLGLDPQEG